VPSKVFRLNGADLLQSHFRRNDPQMGVLSHHGTSFPAFAHLEVADATLLFRYQRRPLVDPSVLNEKSKRATINQTCATSGAIQNVTHFQRLSLAAALLIAVALILLVVQRSPWSI
jgi:hypothetical protein